MTILLYDLVGRDADRPFSPHCWKVKMALVHKGLDYTTEPVRFIDIGGVEEGVSKTVPVIRDGDRVVADSFEIALYLERTYPQRPTLFGGHGGEAMARFVERWSQLTIHPFITTAAILDLHAMQDDETAPYFRRSREQRLGKPLEEVSMGRDAGLSGFRSALEPLRGMLAYQPFIGGTSPLFADYIVFGAFQWARVSTSFRLLAEDDPVALWVERCLDLAQGAARKVPAAA